MKIGICISDATTAAVTARMAELADLADLFEVRADLCGELDLAALFAQRTRPVLLTCRSDSEGGRSADRDARGRLLAEAVALGFDMVDVEARAGFAEIVTAKRGDGLVLSWHDFDGTPDDLDAIHERMAAERPDVIKIVVTARSIVDLGRVLAFARRQADRRLPSSPALVTFAMGAEGVASRVLCGRYGAPFTFASPTNGLETAPGQIPARALRASYRVGMLSRRTRAYGLLGKDVLRSLSPAIHNRAFAELGQDAVYVPLQAAALDGFLRALPDLEIAGFSVTRPYKEAIVPHLAVCEEAAAQAGSVNTVVVRENGALAGSSTDGEGVLGPLERRTAVRGRRVAVLGAGGAARAAAFALVRAGAAVTVLARRPEQAREVAGDSGCAHAGLEGLAGLEPEVVLNATPVGSGAFPGATPVAAESLPRHSIVFDMVYEPRETPLLCAARARGCETIDGVEMLVAQAGGQLRAWLGVEPPLAAMTEAALAAMEESRA